MDCLGIVFDPDDRLPASGLAVLLARLGQEPAGTGVGIYGFGVAGQVVARCLRDHPVKFLAAFDRNTSLGTPKTPAFSPEDLGNFPDLELLIVTVPPQHTFTVGELVARLCPGVRLLMLYSCDSLGQNPQYCHNLLLALRGVGPQPAVLEAERLRVLARVDDRLSRWRAEMDCDAGLSPEAVARRIAAAGMDLGQYLFAQLEQGVDALGRPDGGIGPLERLAREFPYFAPAREALASHHVARGALRDALDAYQPLRRRYPHCYHGLTRCGELRLLCGDDQGARQDFEEARRINPRDPLLAGYLDNLGAGGRPDPLSRWIGRLERRPSPAGRSAMRVAAAVWGEPYLQVFMETSLRSMLAPGNLPYAAARTQLRFSLYTRPEDVASLDRYPQWRSLREVAEIEVIPLEDARQAMGAQTPHKYAMLTCCQNDALERSRRDGAMTYITLGDLIHSDNFIGYGLDRLLEGEPAVLYPASLRFMRESALAAFVRETPAGRPFVFDGVRLFQLLADLVHPDSRLYFRPDYTSDTPGVLLWRAANGSLLQHVFFINAFFMAPLPRPLRMNNTLDVDLGYQVTDGGLGRFHLIRDLGQAAVFELTSEAYPPTGHSDLIRDPVSVAHWLQNNTDQVNRCLGTFSNLYRRDDDFASLERFQPQAAAAVTRLLV
jgi:tetratricopeptide (TPR) repeat protein